eukprot:CAMPEP_0184745160 /NCGR_PEP_ID=MMETSP0315-20130426/7837_1 /TAXON_ID=101924 /ORGANISM="Rhodosorus marinus, Strain UTEX LB 2760" /LENGTH=489 /DNA_ID=CAMNT_0027217181 /DNA_START=18 /DNA_END=1484 /DNA_ORIENTATION=-
MNWQLRPGWIGFLFDGRVFVVRGSRKFIRTTTYCANSGSNGTGGSRKANTDDVVVVRNMPSPVNRSSNERYLGQVFCNRNLNMQKISAIGFDMDYTLSQYIPESFETLAYEGAVQKLVTHLGYPPELLEIPYDHTKFVRGLVIDKPRGNIIKMDRHKYVKIAYHGSRKLTEVERKAVYDPNNTTWDSFTGSGYAVVDTLFSLPDAFLFSAIVDFKDNNPDRLSKSYEEIFKDVRTSVDLCHRDGVIKDKVAMDPAKYIHKDEHLKGTLDMWRESGRKMFLLTNSLYDFTKVVMNFVYGPEWKDVFDIIIVGACKPAFLTDTNLPIYRVKEDGSLANTEGPMFGEASSYLEEGKIFQGGHWKHLHNLLGVSSGSRILYVGDHMYSDILRSKRQLGWRTMLVIPELEHQINVMLEQTGHFDKLEELRSIRDELDGWVYSLEQAAADMESKRGDDTLTEEDELEEAWAEQKRIRAMLREETRAYHMKFHPQW